MRLIADRPAKRPGLSPTALIHKGIRGCGSLFDRKNQIFADFHFPSGLDADTHVKFRLTYNGAWHRDMALTNYDEQDHRLTEPRGKRRQ
jgi:hypothetical protein